MKSLQAMAAVSYAPTNAPCVSSMRYCCCASHAAPDVPWYLKSTSYASYALPAFRMPPAVAATLCTGDTIAAAAPTELRNAGRARRAFHSIRTLRSAQELRAMQHGRVQHAASLLVACSTSACGMQHAACLESICGSSPKSLGLPPELDGIALVEATNILRRLPESSSVEEMLLIVKRTVRRCLHAPLVPLPLLFHTCVHAAGLCTAIGQATHIAQGREGMWEAGRQAGREVGRHARTHAGGRAGGRAGTQAGRSLIRRRV